MKKRLLALLMASMMGFAFVACGDSGSTAAEEPAAETPAAEEPAAEEPAATDDSNADEAPAATGDAITMGVLIYDFSDTYISTVRQALEKYASEAAADITLDMQDGQNDQATQNDQLDVLIEKGVDVLLINAVDAGSAQGLADKAVAAGIPALFFNREPAASVIESANSLFIGTTASEAGVMQGDILADLYEKDSGIDLNGDGVLQYVVFKGEPGNPEAEARTQYAVEQAEERGLTMENVQGDPIVANWQTSEAQDAMQAVLAAHSGEIEVVFCNNDDMALGVIAALNAAGYNMGLDDDGNIQEPQIPVIGVDATDAGMEAINNGKLYATVKQDGDAMGAAIITIAINAAGNESDWLAGTSYNLADDGVSVRIPYSEVS